MFGNLSYVLSVHQRIFVIWFYSLIKIFIPSLQCPPPIAEIGSLRYQPNPQLCALAIVERLGLLEAGGMIRVGPVHYNMLDELAKFGETLEMVAK